jgi:antitoxin component of MazEF toxin-antitoxin module
MTRRNHKERTVRKIIKLGGSYVISIPIEHISELNWREKQKVVVELSGKKLIIKDWKPNKTHKQHGNNRKSTKAS